MDKQAIRALRGALVKIGKVYHASACPEVLVEAVRQAGAPIGALDGIYTGRDGRTVHHLSDEYGLVHIWHRMNSGKYEITCYLTH